MAVGDHPSVLIFDVNETVSDTAPLADRFAEVGAPASLAAPWFAGVLLYGRASRGLPASDCG